MTGQVPSQLGNLTELDRLLLHSNRLTGEIPGDFLRLGSLNWFDFHDNDGLCAPNTSAFTAWLGRINNWKGPRCGGGNRSPVAQGTISAKTVKVGEGVSVNASSYFTDPDGDALTYTASSSRTSVATASVSGSTVTVSGVAAGSATIRITATDPGGLSATQTFSVTVEAGSGGDFEAFSGLRINNDGSVRLQVGGITLSAGRTGCISGGGTLNGKVYDYHWTAWQRDTGSGWTEVSGSKQSGKLCGYDLTSAPSGKYRLVGDMTLAGTRGSYKSENEVTVGGGSAIFGRVLIEDVGLDGVTVSLSNGASTTTSGGGNYRFDNVAAGTFTVTISGYSDDYSFSETSQTVTISAGESAEVNFHGVLTRTSGIAGRVRVDGQGLSAVTVTLSGTESRSITTGDDGQYAFVALAAGDYSVSISGYDGDAYDFEVTSRDVTVALDQALIVNFEGRVRGDDYKVLTGLTITASGAVKWGNLTNSGCIGATRITVSGATYEVHWTEWQRSTSGSAWSQVAGTRKTRQICGYNLSNAAAGTYRWVGELTPAGGSRAKYKSENEVTVGGGGSNRSPVTVGTISSATVQAGESTSVNASSYFSDPDGDALTYAASSSRASVATASVSGRTVTVNGVAAGSATIRITATDPGGLSATQTFSVTVEAGSGGDFEAFSGLRINNDGSVRLQVGGITLSAGRTGCISGGGTLNGKVYDYHWTAWQRDTGSGWTEVSGSKQTGKLCGYDLTSAPSGKYRLVGDMTLAGTRGSYKSENEVTK